MKEINCYNNKYKKYERLNSKYNIERFNLLKEKFTWRSLVVLERLTYNDFLNTNYWEIIKNYIKGAYGNKCFYCNSIDNLHVHHLTYKHRNYEFLFPEDLVCLCEECHKLYHKTDNLKQLENNNIFYYINSYLFND